MHVGDPLLVLAPGLDHGGAGLEALVEDADDAVAEAGDKDVARDLVGGEGCDAGAGARGDVLRRSVGPGHCGGGGGKTYVGADFGGSVPDADDFNIAGDEKFSLSLLPVENEAGVFVARD